ncbi:MAG TPA: radical SAM protein [Desulfuromonadales bacterium]|nr:radical SAM protein [Desulfuromonadales bacterium]
MSFSDPLKILQQFNLRAPKTLTIAITGVCNLVCSHCWVSAGADSAVGHVGQQSLLRMIDDFAAMEGQALRITGGEPLCHPAWLELLRYAVQRGIPEILLQTNGMLLTDGDARALSQLGCSKLSIQISLDGATAATHDRVRGAGAFAGALAGIDRLVLAGLGDRTMIFFTEMQHNLAEIPELLELASARGIGSVVTGTLVQCGRAGEESGSAPPGPDQYIQLLRRYADDASFRELYLRIGMVAAIEWSRSESAREECCTFAENPYLAADGHLYPCLLCHAEPFSVASVFQKGLAVALVEAAPLWSELMKISSCRAGELPECRDCTGKKLCAGGCMGRAWGSHGNLMSADDRCDIRKKIYQANICHRVTEITENS